MTIQDSGQQDPDAELSEEVINLLTLHDLFVDLNLYSPHWYRNGPPDWGIYHVHDGCHVLQRVPVHATLEEWVEIGSRIR